MHHEGLRHKGPAPPSLPTLELPRTSSPQAMLARERAGLLEARRPSLASSVPDNARGVLLRVRAQPQQRQRQLQRLGPDAVLALNVGRESLRRQADPQPKMECLGWGLVDRAWRSRALD